MKGVTANTEALLPVLEKVMGREAALAWVENIAMLNPVFADAMRAGVTAYTEVDKAAAGAAESVRELNQAVDDGKKTSRV